MHVSFCVVIQLVDVEKKIVPAQIGLWILLYERSLRMIDVFFVVECIFLFNFFQTTKTGSALSDKLIKNNCMSLTNSMRNNNITILCIYVMFQMSLVDYAENVNRCVCV